MLLARWMAGALLPSGPAMRSLADLDLGDTGSAGAESPEPGDFGQPGDQAGDQRYPLLAEPAPDRVRNTA